MIPEHNIDSSSLLYPFQNKENSLSIVTFLSKSVLLSSFWDPKDFLVTKLGFLLRYFAASKGSHMPFMRATFEKVGSLFIYFAFDQWRCCAFEEQTSEATLVFFSLASSTTEQIYSERANSNGFDSKIGVGWLQFTSMQTVRENRHPHKKSLSCSLSRSIRVSTVSSDVHAKW